MLSHMVLWFLSGVRAVLFLARIHHWRCATNAMSFKCWFWIHALVRCLIRWLDKSALGSLYRGQQIVVLISLEWNFDKGRLAPRVSPNKSGRRSFGGIIAATWLVTKTHLYVMDSTVALPYGIYKTDTSFATFSIAGQLVTRLKVPQKRWQGFRSSSWTWGY